MPWTDLNRSKRSDRMRKRFANDFYRPFGAGYLPGFYPRLAPWALFLRRFAATLHNPELLSLLLSNSLEPSVASGATVGLAMASNCIQ